MIINGDKYSNAEIMRVAKAGNYGAIGAKALKGLLFDKNLKSPVKMTKAEYAWFKKRLKEVSK